jgi:ubiquinone/menaquinone biosynthesis C-methylase UbiE
MALDAAAELWGSADYERISERFASIHREVVARLEPVRGKRWLDVATGTGGVALRAARAGADVVGIDIAPRMIELARAKAGSLPVHFDVGNAEALPYDDAAFDVVTSVFGIIFAPDHAAVAHELGRVCRSQLVLATWRPNPDLAELFAQFGLETPEGRHSFDWGRVTHVHELLDDAFELQIEPRTWLLEGENGDEIFEFWAAGGPPFKAMLASLDPAKREDFRRAYVAYCERYRDGDRVAVPRDYLIVEGSRR